VDRGRLSRLVQRDKAGIAGLTFHDLRGTAVTRLALMGVEVPEIAAITGHSLKDVHAILDTHYLHRDPQLAWNAIRKLEMGYARKSAASGAAWEQRTRRFSQLSSQPRHVTLTKERKNPLYIYPLGDLGFQPRLTVSESACRLGKWRRKGGPQSAAPGATATATSS
jgi:hypothetical protein